MKARIVSQSVVFVVCMVVGSSLLWGQGYTIVEGPAVYPARQAVIYETYDSAPVYHVQDACSVCRKSRGNCDCKPCLDCDIKMPHCKKVCRNDTKPRQIKILGTIPKISVECDCYVNETPFTAPTKVPQIECSRVTCVEIGQRTIQCLPGCCFSVCIPKADCIKETVECKLVMRVMNMVAKKRKDGSYDVYVINDPDPNSPHYAGGMPETWLVMHCASPAELKLKYRLARAKDGKSIIATAKNPRPSKSDVELDIVTLTDEAGSRRSDSPPTTVTVGKTANQQQVHGMQVAKSKPGGAVGPIRRPRKSADIR